MITRTGMIAALPLEHREALMRLAKEVRFPAGARIFDEGHRADRFWIINTGGIKLDLAIPGRRSAEVETLGPGALLGWSWLCPPRLWHLGATAATPVRAYEFDAAEVLALCDEDPVLGQALSRFVAGVVGDRLRHARTRLLNIYAPHQGEARG